MSQKHERCTFSLHNQLKFQVDSVPHLLLECSGVDANAPNAYLDTFQSMPGSKQGGSPPKADFQMRHIFRSQSLFNGPVASAFNFAADLADILNSTLEPTKTWSEARGKIKRNKARRMIQNGFRERFNKTSQECKTALHNIELYFCLFAFLSDPGIPGSDPWVQVSLSPRHF